MVKRNNAITLISLIITIVIMLILAGVSVSFIIGNNGLFKKATSSAEMSKKASVKEQVEHMVAEWEIEKEDDSISLEDFLNSKVPNELDKIIKDDEKFIVTKNGYDITIDKDGNITNIINLDDMIKIENLRIVTNSDGTGESVADFSVNRGNKLYIVFDATMKNAAINVTPNIPYEITFGGAYNFTIEANLNGTTYTKDYSVYVKKYKAVALSSIVSKGSFIKYDAGTWTQDEINSLGDKYDSENVPTVEGTFGGFKAGDSRNTSVKENTSASRYYQAIFDGGWRVLNFNNTYQTVTLISACCPEVYYEYNFLNNLNSPLLKRDFSMYVNSNVATAARLANYSDLYNIDNNFKASDNDLKKINEWYWYQNDSLYIVDGTSGTMATRNSYGGLTLGTSWKDYGVRIVVDLKQYSKSIGGDGTEANPFILLEQ